MTWNLALPLTAAGAGAAWAQLAAWRAGESRVGFTARALLGGAAAFGLALGAYDAAALAGLVIRWEMLTRGGPIAFAAAAAIGVVEEGAKLAGLLLVVERFRARAVLAAAVGVAGGFSALEALLVLAGESSAPALARAALGPVAHGLLAVPLGLGVVAWTSRAGRRALALPVALATSAALHAASDLALALPGIGAYGYAAALSAPAFLLFAWKKKGPLGWRTLRTHRGRPLLGSPAGGRFRV
ncbi:MAG TPA: PrsW family glutamic-type intramembrane protease [Anaeromyxobacter sp.]